ncbi:MAG: N-acylneuraminate cytidylyltransferase [Parcubacteria group bacterium Gr01-1014_17]|nr:MAG: N-acylneuraminate cytidylyltransferase [Parcubacteria group bacterium Gr01-1014_17]
MQKKTYKVLATVTARGGSKRIPKKSIVPLLGKPSIIYVIEALKKAKRITRLIVDTDDAEIADIGRKAGTEIPFMRPAYLATDTTPHIAVLKYELDFLKEKEGYAPDAVVLVQPTSPLVSSEEIDKCIELLFKENLDSVESVFEVPTHFHPFAQRVIDTERYTHFLFQKERTESKRTGIKPTTYAMGNVYCFRPSNLKEYGTIQGEKSKSVIIERRTAVDIDELFDVEIAETVLKNLA